MVGERDRLETLILDYSFHLQHYNNRIWRTYFKITDLPFCFFYFFFFKFINKEYGRKSQLFVLRPWRKTLLFSLLEGLDHFFRCEWIISHIMCSREGVGRYVKWTLKSRYLMVYTNLRELGHTTYHCLRLIRKREPKKQYVWEEIKKYIFPYADFEGIFHFAPNNFIKKFGFFRQGT